MGKPAWCVALGSKEADSETMFGMQDFDEGVPLGSVGGKQDWAEDDSYKQPLGPLQTQPPSQGALELGWLVRITPYWAPNSCNFIPPASFSHWIRKNVTGGNSLKRRPS